MKPIKPHVLSGSQKRKRRVVLEKDDRLQTGALERFLSRNTQVENVMNEFRNEEDAVNESVNEEDAVNQSVNEEVSSQNENVESITEEPHDTEVVILLNLDDPGNWGNLTKQQKDDVIKRGPQRGDIVDFPVNIQGRHFSLHHYSCQLPNGEKMDRKWLVYSVVLNKVYCFCCTLFKRSARATQLNFHGSNDWHNITQKLRDHEGSCDHLVQMKNWSEFRRRFETNTTIDQAVQDMLEMESQIWRRVILRILAIVKTLARSNLAFRGDHEKIYEEKNGNFLGLVEMIAEFDSVMQEHIRRFQGHEVRNHYLSHKIQNELIHDMANEVRSVIVKNVKGSKYFAIILDCTPDVSHEEQMSIVVRHVNVSRSPVKIEEYFLGFLKVEDTSGLGIFNELKDQLDIEDLRGQGYDNGANMRGKHKGVQNRVLQVNPRAFFTPCGCHSLNLALCDMANSCTKAVSFFGVVQRIYCLFSSSVKRLALVEKHMKGYTLKNLSATRWESRVDSVKAIISSPREIRNALIDLAETTGDPKSKSEAESLASHEMENFEFLFAMIIWYQLLLAVNRVSKTFQNEDMQMDVAIAQLKDLIKLFQEYRESGFSRFKTEAEDIANEMEIAPTFLEKRKIRRKKQFDETTGEDQSLSAAESFEFNFYNYILDQALSSLKSRFEQFEIYEQTFGFLFNVKAMQSADECSLKTFCNSLDLFLTHDGHSDIDGTDLYHELLVLRNVIPENANRAIDVLNYLKRMDESAFPNAWVAYRIMLTIPVTVASAERTFSRLKLIKTYLRSTMSQDRLNGLAILSIESKMAGEVDYENVIRTFASRHASRSMFMN